MTKSQDWIIPALPWEDGFPYLVMQPFGLTPASTALEAFDASFEMTHEQAADPMISRASVALRITGSRLVVDFFCPELPALDPPPPPPRLLPFALLAAIEDAVLNALPDEPAPDIDIAFPPTLPPRAGERDEAPP